MSRTGLALLLALLTLGTAGTASAQSADGFYYTDGFWIKDGDGNVAVRRGIGLGGWLMPEAYMLQLPFGASITRMTEEIEALIGPEDTERFWDLYLDHYVAEKDVQAIAEWGFDHIRLPFHYAHFVDYDTAAFKEEGFARLDAFLGWCEDAGIPVILDLHAAPGAQSESDISDSDGVARFWTEPAYNQGLAIALWEEMARRYKDNRNIIGYDLLNEPVTPNSIGNGAAALRSFYERATTAIRAIDTHHILFIEGNYWATTFDDLTPPFDDNMAYSFHKYWNNPDTGTIRYLLDIRSTHNVPLWMGESGENSNVWYAETVDLLESNGIGWNWWTHKKVATITSPVSAPITPGYKRVLQYWRGEVPKPSPDEAREGLFEMAYNLDLDSTTTRPGVLQALLNPNFSTMQRPFRSLWIPGTIEAVHYDIGTQGVAYFDQDYWRIGDVTGNSGYTYRNDGVDIEWSTDPFGYHFNVGWFEEGEWMEYTLADVTPGTYDIEFRVASNAGTLELRLDEFNAYNVAVPATGGFQTWVSVWLRDVDISDRVERLRVTAKEGSYINFNQMTFHRTDGGGEQPADAFRIGSLYPNPAATDVTIEFLTQRDAQVSASVYDMLGREYTGTAGSFGVGQYEIELPVDELAQGLYLVQLQFDDGSGTYTQRKPLVIVK